MGREEKVRRAQTRGGKEKTGARRERRETGRREGKIERSEIEGRREG